jgi:hypothetical protein
MRTQCDPMSATTPSELCTVASEDCSLLHRGMFALCHGENLIDAIDRGEGQEQRMWKLIVTQSFAVSDIVRNTRRLSTGVVKYVVSPANAGDNASDPLFDLMGEVGISLFKATVMREEFSKVEGTIKAGVDMTKLSMMIMLVSRSEWESAERSGMINIPR